MLPAMVVGKIAHLEGSVGGGNGGNRRQRVGADYGRSGWSRGGLVRWRRSMRPPRVLHVDGELPALILGTKQRGNGVCECGDDAREKAGQEEERE